MRALEGLDGEVIVSDNASADNSIAYLQPLFPSVHFIVNSTNLGFAKANNQALAHARGEYILFLNPDTLVPEDSFHKCLAFLKQQNNAGGLGIRMLDGRGNFLPESKRAFPSPWVSFRKLSGLAALFPRSGYFNRYALGDLDEKRNHAVDVLAGAFMLIKKELLLQLNGFDEQFFLYGEDIDLSFRIKQAGFQNYYFGETAIIHFKGESSANAELNRIRHFYSAMQLFVQKHYTSGAAKVFAVFLKIAIVVRGLLSALGRLLKPVLLPLSDGLLVWLSLFFVSQSWIVLIRHGKTFGVNPITWLLPSFALLFVVSATVSGLYDKRYKTPKTLAAILFSAIILLAAYSLLPERLRFSRGVILYGTILGGIAVFLFRQLLLQSAQTLFMREENRNGQIVIVADEKEYESGLHLLTVSMNDRQLLGRVSPLPDKASAICAFEELPVLEKKMRIIRIIYCIGRLSLNDAIKQMTLFGKKKPQLLFHYTNSHAMIGAQTIVPDEAIIAMDVHYRISGAYEKRMKRLVDMFFSLLFLLLFPVHFFCHHKPLLLIMNALLVLVGSRTWVGYASSAEDLPVLAKGVISSINPNGLDPNLLAKADRLYARQYDWWNDTGIIVQNYRNLGKH